MLTISPEDAAQLPADELVVLVSYGNRRHQDARGGFSDNAGARNEACAAGMAEHAGGGYL